MKHYRCCGAGILLGAVVVLGTLLLMNGCTETQTGRERTQIDIDSPGEAEVCSKAEHVSIYVRGKLDRVQYRIPSDLKLLEYKIRIFVHPLDADGLWRQNPTEALEQWTAQAYLGGRDEYSARHGQQFQIFAVLTKAPLKDKYSRMSVVLQEPDTYLISQVKTVSTLRQCS